MPTSERTHRERAVVDLTTDLAVTAGAGAGKTTVLVDRFVAIAREPRLGPDRILAITFTRKAAAEMKERIVRVFERADDAPRRRATEAAYISTIHGFAERVLRERPFDARIDPAFQVLTDYDQQRFLLEARQTMYARPELRRFAQRLGREFRGEWQVFTLVAEVARLIREGSEAARREADLVGDEAACVELALARVGEIVARWQRDAMTGFDQLTEHLADRAAYRSFKAQYEQAQAYLDAARRCLECGTFDPAGDPFWSAIGFTAALTPEARERARPVLQRVKELGTKLRGADVARQEALERELLPLKRAVYEAAAEIDRLYRARKERSGALDFHDLQLRAAALFDDVPAVRSEYAERFRHILLDESQDTDEIQHRLVARLHTRDNVLFIVGDPKQAIYEFRGADPDVFDREVRRLPEAARLTLPENFRSRPEIVAFINHVGGPLLGERFTPIVPCADYGGRPLDGPAVTMLLAIKREVVDGEGTRTETVADVRPREAAALAEEVVRLLRSEMMVRDPEARELSWVPLRPRHVAVLFRTRTPIPYFERAFAEREIPYVTAAGQGYYERAEVLDCMMVLRTLDQPLDDLALAAVLRSPVAAATDDDLWRLRTIAGDRPLYSALSAHPVLASFHARWEALRRRCRGRSAVDALDAVLAEFAYEPAVAAHQDGRAMLANVAKLRRLLRDLGAVPCGVAYAELQRLRELMDAESQAPLVGPVDDVVVFTTIHQAKGLEWPVVCLPNLQAGDRGTMPSFSARHGVLTLDALDANGEKERPISVLAIDEEIRARQEQERRRLFYVALTRARERLLLSGIVAEKDLAADAKLPDGFNAPLPFLLANTGDALRVANPDGHDCGGYRMAVRRVEDPVDVRTLLEAGEPLARSLEPTVVSSVAPDRPLPVAAPASVKVTELLAFRRCPQVYRFGHVLEIEEHLPRRAAVHGAAAEVSPVALGTTVHRLLERARFDAPDVAAEAARLVADEPAELHERLRALLLPVLGGDVGTAVRAGRRVEREWPFVMSLAGVTVEGVVDLAVEDTAGRWTVYDYKSNDFSRHGRFDFLVDYYTPQLELYAFALSRAGMQVAACSLVFLSGPRTHGWRFDPDVQALEAWAVETIGRIARRDYATTAGPKCEQCAYRKRKVCDVGRSWTPAMGATTSSGTDSVPR